MMKQGRIHEIQTARVGDPSPANIPRFIIRKRARCTSSSPVSFVTPGVLVLFLATLSAMVSPACSFPPFQSATTSTSSRQIFTLNVARQSNVADRSTPQPVKMKTAIPAEKRLEAMKAMKRQKVESALTGVNARMLELLSDGYLYPSPTTAPTKRRKGRPECVPGAMKYETMLKFRERQEALDLVGGGQEFAAIAAFIENESPSTTPTDDLQEKSSVAAKVDEVKKEKRVKKPKGTDQSNTIRGIQEVHEEGQSEPRKRKRVVKNLPKPRDRSKDDSSYLKSSRTTKGRAGVNSPELQKYYKTELLTREEEYSLGMKVKFMVKCEQVHEGLANALTRLPTIEEWANACG